MTSWACGSPHPGPGGGQATPVRLGGQLIARAQESGQLRADTHEDLIFVTWANSRILPAVRAAGASDAWRRHLGFLLDGFRADRAHPLPEPPLAPRQVYRAMLVLGRRSAGTTNQHQPR